MSSTAILENSQEIEQAFELDIRVTFKPQAPDVSPKKPHLQLTDIGGCDSLDCTNNCASAYTGGRSCCQ